MHVFNWSADGLDFKVDMSYEASGLAKQKLSMACLLLHKNSS